MHKISRRFSYGYQAARDFGVQLGMFLFVAFGRVLEVALYLAATPAAKTRIWPVLLGFALGTTLLSAGVWFRQAWARKLLLCVLFVTVVFEIIWIALRQEGLIPVGFLFVAAVFAQILFFFFLLSRSVKDYASGR